MPVISVPGAETYELVRDTKAWERIEAELHPILQIGDREVRVQYHLCADLKSLLPSRVQGCQCQGRVPVLHVFQRKVGHVLFRWEVHREIRADARRHRPAKTASGRAGVQTEAAGNRRTVTVRGNRLSTPVSARD